MASSDLGDLIGRGVAGSQPAAGVPGRLYYDTTNSKMTRDNGSSWDDCEPGGVGGDVTYAAILASQLTNEIKGWPPIVSTGDLDALNLWFDKVGTPSTAPSVVAGNDGGITMQYNLVLKVVADGANEGLSQTWTYANEPRVKAGRALSTLWAVWCVGGVGVTAKLTSSDASHTDAAKVTDAAWTIVEVPNHTLAGTSCTVSLTTDGAGTFYAVPLGANIGARGFPLAPRGLRYVDTVVPAASLVNGVDPGGADFADVDCTAATSPLACMAQLNALYSNANTAGTIVFARRNGETATSGVSITRAATAGAGVTYLGIRTVALDDGQIFEYKTGAAAGDGEAVYIGIQGFWEWE